MTASDFLPYHGGTMAPKPPALPAGASTVTINAPVAEVRRVCRDERSTSRPRMITRSMWVEGWSDDTSRIHIGGTMERHKPQPHNLSGYLELAR